MAAPDANATTSARTAFLTAEFSALRSEIGDRTRSQWNLLALAITSTAGLWGLVFAHKVTVRVVFALALLTPSLGRLWADHDDFIARAATYINDRLRPVAVEETGDHRVLGWEQWLHEDDDRDALAHHRGGLRFRATIMAFFIAPAVASLGAGFYSLVSHHHRVAWWWWLLAGTATVNTAMRIPELLRPVLEHQRGIHEARRARRRAKRSRSNP